MKLVHFAWVGGVEIFSVEGGTYVQFISDLDVCTDGSGSAHGDDYHLDDTAYQPTLNADTDPYIVTPPKIRLGVAPIVLGCLGRVTRLNQPKTSFYGVVAEIGPSDKTGECAYCLAKALNEEVTANSGDSRLMYLYEMWPGIPAVIDGKRYKLIPA